MSKAYKVPIHKQIADIFRTLAFTYREIIVFELIYKTLTLFIFIPAISFIFRGLLRLGGFAGATNYELLQFVISGYGLLCMLILVPIATLLIFFRVFRSHYPFLLRSQKTADRAYPGVFAIAVLPSIAVQVWISGMGDLSAAVSAARCGIRRYAAAFLGNS